MQSWSRKQANKQIKRDENVSPERQIHAANMQRNRTICTILEIKENHLYLSDLVDAPEERIGRAQGGAGVMFAMVWRQPKGLFKYKPWHRQPQSPLDLSELLRWYVSKTPRWRNCLVFVRGRKKISSSVFWVSRTNMERMEGGGEMTDRLAQHLQGYGCCTLWWKVHFRVYLSTFSTITHIIELWVLTDRISGGNEPPPQGVSELTLRDRVWISAFQDKLQVKPCTSKGACRGGSSVCLEGFPGEVFQAYKNKWRGRAAGTRNYVSQLLVGKALIFK